MYLAEDITFVARNGELVLGVVHAKTFWGALHIKYLYVVPENRGNLIGKLLMGKVLEKGEEKGSRFAFVETMSFQALGFYKKMGFTEEFCRPGYDKDTSFHYLRKDF